MNLFEICSLSFIYVFIVLSILAVLMRVIILVFPARPAGNDTAVYSAIAAASARQFPGFRVKKIKEIK